MSYLHLWTPQETVGRHLVDPRYLVVLLVEGGAIINGVCEGENAVRISEFLVLPLQSSVLRVVNHSRFPGILDVVIKRCSEGMRRTCRGPRRSVQIYVTPACHELHLPLDTCDISDS